MKKSRIKPQDEGLWLISYSDLITSILAVLVLVMSFSKIDIEKIDHANRLLNDKKLMTLDTLKREFNKIINENNLSKAIKLKLDDNGLNIIMSSAFQFNVNSAKLNKEALKKIEPIFEKVVNISKKREIIIAGFTDNTGTPERNWELSSQRAYALMIYLMKKGLNYKFAHIRAFASNKPLKIDENLSLEAQRALNRRVNIIIGKTHKY
jgi:flagellar motor protein MotB